MTQLEGILAPVCPEVEAQLRPHLEGFFGGIIRGYLPQDWVFKSEAESVTVRVAKDGTVRVLGGASPSADVTIKSTLTTFRIAIASRQRGSVDSTSVEILYHSRKGKTAFDFVRSRLGF